jgi:Flp pilus assembly protein TadG
MMGGSVTRQKQKGFSLLLAACCLTVMIGMFGLTVDLGRMYVVKSEIQGFADAAALASALRLNGTSGGITSANAIGQTGPGTNRWNFSTETIPANDVNVTFATSKDGPWQAADATGTGAGYRFTRVNVTTNLPVYFIRILQGLGATQSVNAVAIAGQAAETNPGKWTDPFSPDALNRTDTNFGFTLTSYYTMVWPPNGHRSASESCPGDWAAGYTGQRSASSDRGYIQLNPDANNGNPGLEAAILHHYYGADLPTIAIGDQIDTIPGQRNSLEQEVTGALAQRASNDTDTTSTTYAEYAASQSGNGSRVLRVPINWSGEVIGFATFFVPKQPCDARGWPCCAEFVSNQVLMGGNTSAGSSGKVYRVKLF